MSRRTLMVLGAILLLVIAGALIFTFRQRTDKVPDSLSQSTALGQQDSAGTKTPITVPSSSPSPEASASPTTSVANPDGIQTTHMRYKKLFPEGKVLAEEQSGLDTEGNQIQTQVLEVKLKYPKVKWVERVNKVTGEVASQETYVATHVLIERPENVTEEEFQSWIDRAQGKVIGRVGDRTVRVAVQSAVQSKDGAKEGAKEGKELSAQDLLHAVDRLKERLEKESSGRAGVDFDFVRFTR